MAILDFETTHALKREQWSDKLYEETTEELYLNKLMGTDERNPIVVQHELEMNAGDQLTVGKSFDLDPDSGVEGAETLEGKEQSLEFGSDKMTAIEMRNAVRMKNGLGVYATALKLRDRAKRALSYWKAQELDNRMFAALVANPTANRQIEADSTADYKATVATGIDGIATGDVLTVRGIMKLKSHAITGNVGASEKMKGVKDHSEFGLQTFIFLVDTHTLMDLKNDPEYKEWATEDSKARAKFFSGAGVCDIDGVIIVNCDKIPRVQNAGGVMVSKNIFLGSSALAVTYTGTELMNGQRGLMQWDEEEFDYGRQAGIAIGDVKGVKKIKFTKDDGSVQDDNGVILFYAASVVS